MTIEKLPAVTAQLSNAMSRPAQAKSAANASQVPVNEPPKASVDLHHSIAQLTSSTHSDMDSEKVERLRNAIAQGNYPIDTAKIAEGLLAAYQE